MTPIIKLHDRILVAIGGHATHPEDIEGTSREQKAVAASTAEALLPLVMLDNELVVTRGNGPVVGKIPMRQVLARNTIAPIPLDICIAHSQGGIAYLLMQAVENAIREAGSSRHVACLLTQVEFDPDDPAFDNLSKPIGTFYDQRHAEQIEAELRWQMKEDAARRWRHVVPSPKPKHICDISLIQMLAGRGTVVIAGGGGGIPVIRGPKGVRQGVQAVIDKDLTSAHMANVLGIELLVILTSVPKVSVHFGDSCQKDLDLVTMREVRRLQTEGHFPRGGMEPKIDAALRFLDGDGKRVIIAQLEEAMPALRGETGTHIVADHELPV